MDHEPIKLATRIGNPVSGPDFWPRPEVVDSLFDDLVAMKGSRRLFGLRRIGKTSVLLELERRLRAVDEPKLTVIRINAEGVSRFADFLDELFKQIPSEDKLKQARQNISGNTALKGLFAGVYARLTGGAPPALTNFQNEFAHQAVWAGDIEAALKEAGPVVLIVDELPSMLRNMMRGGEYSAVDVERFLATLRKWRMNAGVRMLLSGSIGLAQLKRLDGVAIDDHIGDLHPRGLPPLGREQAIEMVEALARGAGLANWSRALSEAMVAASAETWPIFLQCGFDEIRKSGVRDPAAVGAIIETKVRLALNETFYNQFSTPLTRYGDEEYAARRLLKAVVAAHPQAATLDAVNAALTAISALEKRDDLIEALCEDDFLLLDTEAQSLRPASKLVPIWVRARAWGR